MARRLSEKKREAMFQAWKKHRSVEYVVKTCKVAANTVYRYMELERWKKRADDIGRNARHIVDSEAAFTMAGELRALQGMIDAVAGALTKEFEDPAKIPTDPKLFRDLILAKMKLLEVVEPEIAEPVDEAKDGWLRLALKLDDNSQQKLAEGIAAVFAKQKARDFELESRPPGT